MGVLLGCNRRLLPRIHGVSISGGSRLPLRIVDILFSILGGSRSPPLHSFDLFLDNVFVCIRAIGGRRILFLSLGLRNGHGDGDENGGDGGGGGTFSSFSASCSKFIVWVWFGSRGWMTRGLGSIGARGGLMIGNGKGCGEGV